MPLKVSVQAARSILEATSPASSADSGELRLHPPGAGSGIACGYEDANDLDRLRGDPAFKLACGRPPDSGDDLCSQPTVSRWENAPDLKTIIRLTYALVDAWCDSYVNEPEAVKLPLVLPWVG